MATVVAAAELRELRKKVDEHECWIDGNGNPGAKTRLALLERAIPDIRKDLTKIRKRFDWILGVLVAILVPVLIWLITDVIPRAFGG